jgi:FkbM family methyltransferase
VGFRWLLAVACHFSACRKSGNLQPADAALGDGPFHVRLGKSRAILSSRQVITGIREIWVRNPYLGDFLTLGPEAAVVDLGANMGVFTALALGHGPGVHVVAIEADPLECERFRKTVAENGTGPRIQLINAFVGGSTGYQNDLKATDRATSIPSVTEQEILSRAGGGPIHLLKCDIEGSEFAMFANPGPLLAAAQQIAAELHPDSGDTAAALNQLRQMGFELEVESHPPTLLIRGRRKIDPTKIPRI